MVSSVRGVLYLFFFQDDEEGGREGSEGGGEERVEGRVPWYRRHGTPIQTTTQSHSDKPRHRQTPGSQRVREREREKGLGSLQVVGGVFLSSRPKQATQPWLNKIVSTTIKSLQYGGLRHRPPFLGASQIMTQGERRGMGQS